MRDAAVENARRRKAELLQEIKEIDLFLSLHEKFSQGISAEESRDSGEVGESDADAVGANDSGLKVISGLDMEEPIREALMAASRPLTLSKLMTKLNELGYRVSGEHPAKNLGTVLWRLKDHFLNLKGYGYWLKDKGYAPAGYSPTQEHAHSRPTLMTPQRRIDLSS